MPLLDLDNQRRFAEIGRVRIGRKNPKGFPEKLDCFRFTSMSKPIIESVADLYGGDVRPWKPDPKGSDQFEVTTPARALEITVAPGQTISAFWECWKAAKCLRRCDGITERLTGQPCKCPTDPAERAELASRGQACKPTTRFSFVLNDVPYFGLFRLESKGMSAALELGASAQILEYATARGIYVPATLRLQERPGPKGKIYVPVLELAASYGDLRTAFGLAELGSRNVELGSGSQAIAALPPAPAPTEAPAAAAAASPEGFVDRQTGRIHVPVTDTFDPATGRPIEDVPFPVDPPLPGEEGHPEAAGPRPIVVGDDDVVEAEIVEEITAAPAPEEAAGPTIASTVTPSSVPEPAEAVTSGPTEGGASLIGTAPDGPATPAGDGAFSQGLMIAARKAELDDETRHAIIAKITNGRTGSTKDVTAAESTELHNVFALLRMKKVSLAFSPDGEVSWS